VPGWPPAEARIALGIESSQRAAIKFEGTPLITHVAEEAKLVEKDSFNRAVDDPRT